MTCRAPAPRAMGSAMFRRLSALLALAALAGCKPAVDHTTAGNAPRTQAASSTATGFRLDPNQVVAEWNGGKITYGDLRKKKESTFKKLQNKYLLDLYQAEQRELEAAVIDTLIEEAAKKAGKPPTDYMTTIAGSPSVTDEEIQAFYDQNVKASGQPFDQIKDRIRGYLLGTKQREIIQKEIDRLKAEAHVKIDLPMPETVAVTFALDGRPMKGKPSAKVTVVEFSDFECPYCSQAVGSVAELMKSFP